MGVFDFLEDIGGRSGSIIQMITDWKVLLVFLLLAFLAFILLIAFPVVIWVMNGMRMP